MIMRLAALVRQRRVLQVQVHLSLPMIYILLEAWEWGMLQREILNFLLVPTFSFITTEDLGLELPLPMQRLRLIHLLVQSREMLSGLRRRHLTILHRPPSSTSGKLLLEHTLKKAVVLLGVGLQ